MATARRKKCDCPLCLAYRQRAKVGAERPKGGKVWTATTYRSIIFKNWTKIERYHLKRIAQCMLPGMTKGHNVPETW